MKDYLKYTASFAAMLLGVPAAVVLLTRAAGYEPLGGYGRDELHAMAAANQRSLEELAVASVAILVLGLVFCYVFGIFPGQKRKDENAKTQRG